MTTKKVKETGKFGVRGGVGIRKKFLLAKKDNSKKVCPNCGQINKMTRKAAGIFECTSCKTNVAGGAYKYKTAKS